jgi:hypothetical protein
MKDSTIITIALANSGFLGSFVNMSATYDFGEGILDECGNLVGSNAKEDTGASPRSGDNTPEVISFMSGNNYATTYTSCHTESCITSLNLETGTAKKVSYSLNGYQFDFVTQSATGPNDRCVWHGTVTYNGALVKNVDGTFSKGYREGSLRMYFSEDGEEVTSSDDYAYYVFMGSSTTSSSGNICYSMGGQIYTQKPELFTCYEGNTLRTEGTYRVYCEGAPMPAVALRDQGGMQSYTFGTTTTFIKDGNSLPCVASREAPVTQRSESFTLIDAEGNSLGNLDGYVVTLEPGEEKLLRMQASIEQLVRNQSYSVQVSALAKGDEGEAANDYEWYKE